MADRAAGARRRGALTEHTERGHRPQSTEYAEGGVGQYWIVDPEHSEIDVYANRDGAWDLLLHLDESSPEGEVVVGEHGTVPIDLREVLS